MPKKIYTGVNNTARNVKGIYIGVNNLARKVKKVYVGVNNLARLCWSEGTVGPTVPCSIPRMTSATTPSGTVTWSTARSDQEGYRGYHAFSGASGKSWSPKASSDLNPWVKYDFGYLVQPTDMQFTMERGGVQWHFLGSTDDLNWTELCTIQGYASGTHVYDFSFSTTNMYRYFMLSSPNNQTLIVYISNFYLNGLKF